MISACLIFHCFPGMTFRIDNGWKGMPYFMLSPDSQRGLISTDLSGDGSSFTRNDITAVNALLFTPDDFRRTFDLPLPFPANTAEQHTRIHLVGWRHAGSDAPFRPVQRYYNLEKICCKGQAIELELHDCSTTNKIKIYTKSINLNLHKLSQYKYVKILKNFRIIFEIK